METPKNPQRGYNYQPEDGKFYIYKGTKRILPPKGGEVWTDEEPLAQELIRTLRKDPKGYTSPANLLCYQYTYCDLVGLQGHDREWLRQELKKLADIEFLYHDEYQTLGQDCPIMIDYPNYYADILPAWLDDLDFNKLIAVLVFYYSLDSLVLAYRMMSEVVDKVAQGSSFDQCCDSFAEELKEFLLYEDITWYHSIVPTIKAFTFYCLNR